MILNIDKPYGWTSTDVVRKLRNVMIKCGYPRKVKVGHAGTLDPLATGVLLICTEKDTKRVEELQMQQKEYVFTMELGATTVSFDMEHPVSERFPVEHITQADIERVVAGFCGEQLQTPPLYSAKRINGQRAYELARGGAQDKDVEIRQAQITVYEIEVVEIAMPQVTVRALCSKGTYVRSLARDIALELGSGAYLTALRRTKSGGYRVEESLDLDGAVEVLSTAAKLFKDNIRNNSSVEPKK